MTDEHKTTLKRLIPTIAFILFLIPVVTSSLLDLEQKIANEKAEQAKKQAIIDTATKIYLLGKFEPSTRKDFAAIPAMYNIAGHVMYLRKEALAAFEDMATAALKAKVELNITSATRNFEYQKDLWNKKWEGITFEDGKNLLKSIPDEPERFAKILEYSAVPGASRHHWGTEVDINGVNPNYFETEAGEKVYQWLVANAPSYGFCQPYTKKGQDRPTGYNEEKWHWSYLPISKNLTQEYKRIIKDTDISGFDGDEYVPTFNLIHDYVLDINSACF